MGIGWHESRNYYNQIYNDDQFEHHKHSLGSEAIAGGAAMAGFKAFEDHQRKEGKPISHAFAKEVLAGFAGAEIDKIAKKRGDGWFDKEKAKREARKDAANMYDQHYIQGHGADQYNPDQYGPPDTFNQMGW